MTAQSASKTAQSAREKAQSELIAIQSAPAESLHIASLVVHTQPTAFESVAAWLESQPATEVHARSPAGKLVVVIESSHERELLEITERVRDHAGVLGAALIYHEHVEAPNEAIEPSPAPIDVQSAKQNCADPIPAKGANP